MSNHNTTTIQMVPVNKKRKEIQDIIRESKTKQKLSTSLTNIQNPGSNDVLCGRGGVSQNHRGNKAYRAVITENKVRYVESCRHVKHLIVRSIVDAVRLQIPPGRFLEKDDDTGLWYDIGDRRAFAKVCVLVFFYVSLFIFKI